MGDSIPDFTADGWLPPGIHLVTWGEFVARFAIFRKSNQRIEVSGLLENVLPGNPQLFAVMSEAPLDDLNRLRKEISGYVQELKPAG